MKFIYIDDGRGKIILLYFNAYKGTYQIKYMQILNKYKSMY